MHWMPVEVECLTNGLGRELWSAGIKQYVGTCCLQPDDLAESMVGSVTSYEATLTIIFCA